MQIQLIEETVQLDYAGWETVCFDTMKWFFNQNGEHKDERDLKRVDEHTWMITSDFGGWQNFDQGCGETTVLEEYYQEYLLETKT